MTLSVYNIKEGVNEGEVIYHCYVEKTPEEIQKLREIKEKEKLEKKIEKERKKRNLLGKWRI